MPGHLYTPAEKRAFERRYGKKHGDYVFGATVGKVYRERKAAGKCSVRGCRALPFIITTLPVAVIHFTVLKSPNAS